MSQTKLTVSPETRPEELLDRIVDLRAEKRELRRNFLKSAGIGAAALAAAALLPKDAHAQRGAVDPLVLNFALNLEYLEAQYYTYATTGTDITTYAGIGTNGVGTQGGVTVKASPQVRFSLSDVQDYANEIALDERNHVAFLRSALGTSAVAQPQIDLLNSFAAAGSTSFVNVPGFDPFGSSTSTSIVNDLSFLIGAFVFEDVGVTAYKGGALLLTNKTYLEAAAGIMGVEAYHAGEVRTFLYSYRNTVVPGSGGQTVAQIVQGISNLRDAVDNQGGDGTAGDDRDQGIVGGSDPGVTTSANIVPADSNSIAYTRDTGSVLRIVYLGGALGTGGGFFPNGMNGSIR